MLEIKSENCLKTAEKKNSCYINNYSEYSI